MCHIHTHPTYKADNETLFHIINTALADTEYAASIKRHIRAKDGRGAYLGICLHHQGSNKWKAAVELADKKLTTMRRNDRSRRYTLAMHIANARSYRNDLLWAAQYVPADVPTEPTRVTRLLNSIKTWDQFLISAIIPTNSPSTGVDVRYHIKDEYNELSPDEKEELAAIRTAARKVNKDFGKKPKWNGNPIILRRKPEKQRD